MTILHIDGIIVEQAIKIDDKISSLLCLIVLHGLKGEKEIRS